jgi:spermidine synthase
VNPLVLVLFFLSGAAGLVYEVLWTRQLSLVFGVTTYAVSTVLATFMGGLALGSWLIGRAVDRRRNPLLVYALLEAGIGLYALAIPTGFTLLRPAYVALHRLGLSYALFSAGRALLAGLVLLPPTTLMGGTFPVLLRAWVARPEAVGRGAGVLYFVNTAGAIAGSLLAGFVLIERFGLTGTTRLAALANLALAAAAAVLARRAARDAAAGEAEAPAAAALSPAAVRIVLACAALAGFVSLAAEVLWTRALLRYLHNSTYAFTTMLATFLFGIALGSAVYTVVFARSRRPLVVLAMLQVGVALGLEYAAVHFPYLPFVTAPWTAGPVVHSFAEALGMQFARAALILVPPVVFLGALFPLATALVARGGAPLGRSAGRVYAVNTLGAILGSLACAFVLIPTIGMWRTIELLVALGFLGAGAVVVATLAGRTRLLSALAVAIALAIAVADRPGNVFRDTFLPWPNMRLVFYAEGATDTVGVAEAQDQRMIIYEDQRGTAATHTYPFNFFFGHLPMLLHPGTPRHVLHICFGVGNSLSAVASHDEVERVDNVELSPHVLEAGPLFWSNDGVLRHPKVRTIIDDGRNHLLTTSETYDVILLEPPEMFTAGVVNLYTEEFYREALAHLAPDGVVMQWLPVGNAALDDERMMFRAFWDVFPHATTWWQLRSGCALLVGTRAPLRIDYQRLRRHITEEARVRQDMALSQVRDVDHLLSWFVFDEAAFADFVRDVRPTTDDHTVVDFSIPRFGGSGFGLGQFTAPIQVGGVSALGVVAQREKFYLDQRRSVVPLLFDLGGDAPEAVAERIERSRALGTRARWYTEAEWRRMRADGRTPD